MPDLPSRAAGGPVVHNRIAQVLMHTTRYAFKSQARLASDARVSEAAISRLINGRSNPSYQVVCAVTRALGKATGRPLNPNELISFNGTYPTPSVCDLVGCPGCLPDEAYDDAERLRPEYRGVRPGEWAVSPQAAQSQFQPAASGEGQ